MNSFSFFFFSLARRDLEKAIENLEEKITHKSMNTMDYDFVMTELSKDPLALEIVFEPNVSSPVITEREEQ